MSGFGVVLDGEGEKRGAGWGAQLVDWSVIEAVEASTFAWGKGRVFDPDFEAAVHAYGGYEVGVDGWGKPVDLSLISAMSFEAMDWMRLLLGFRNYGHPRYRRDSRCRHCEGCILLSCRQLSLMQSGFHMC